MSCRHVLLAMTATGIAEAVWKRRSTAVPAEPPHHGVGDLPTCRDAPAAVVRSQFLTTTGRRGYAAAAILAHSPVPAQSALTAADLLDLTCRAILGGVGITDPEDARVVLATLWAGRAAVTHSSTSTRADADGPAEAPAAGDDIGPPVMSCVGR
jgi:hypothetical protein